EPRMVEAMKEFARLAAQSREALLARDYGTLGALMNYNFDLRRTIYDLPAWQRQMVEAARACGASAKFAGSGGAIVGIARDTATFDAVRDRLADIGSRTIRPQVTE
ncbi:MAG TPA: GHMP kinase, partial [Vicinamibacteria bacterium]|nr:GHMP kinase [Vicinamibacteria bacterium]